MKFKKLLNLILIFIISFFLLANKESVAANPYENLDNTLNMINSKIKNFSKNEQNKKYKLFINIIQKAKNKASKQSDKERYQYILDYFLKNLNNIQEPIIETTNITNINQEIIENKRLQLHNQERSSLWLNNFIINTQLNNTAQKRANYLASINNSTHKRKVSDWYYNYDSIKYWFQENWIEFSKEENWIASFSENIAQQTYKCSQNDCTQYFLWQIDKWFQFFMWEKNKSYKPHYNAISSPYFQEIWLWYAKVWNRFFIVTHYWKFQ